MASDKIVILGAGAVGRGLVGRVLSEAGFGVVFLESDEAVVSKLSEAGVYTVHLVGEQREDRIIERYEVLGGANEEGIKRAVCDCGFLVTAVGGQHLGEVAGLIKRGSAGREGVLNILVCENWPEAEKVLEKALVEAGCERDSFSCVNCSVERMARRAEGSLDVIVEPGAILYANSRLWSGELPDVKGFIFTDKIEVYYARKLYTSNLGHAVLAYLGYLKGYEYIYEAMDDGKIRSELEVLFGIVREGFLNSYDMKSGELDRHIEELLSWRYSNRSLADTIARVGRGVLRKLGERERLVGVARMLERCGLATRNITRVIGAAMHYRSVDDPESGELVEMIEKSGVGQVLERVCGFLREEALYAESLSAYDGIGREGGIGN